MARGESARFRTAAEPALFFGSRTWRDHQADFRSRGTRAAEPGGAGQPLRDQAAGAKLAPIPPADSRAQPLFPNVLPHAHPPLSQLLLDLPNLPPLPDP